MPLTKKRGDRDREMNVTPELFVDMPVNQFVVNKNHGTGLFVNELFDGYPAYRIRLSNVDDIFEGKTQHWDEDYDNARLIFGDGIESKASRVLVRAHHSSIYYGLACSVESGFVTDAESLKTLLHNGVHKTGTIILYSFVIVAKILHFAPTGDEFMKDMISKHAAHSNCAEEVTYSGDFFFVNVESNKDGKMKISTEGGELTLVISNCSGTYKPDKELLPKVKQLFKKNFPGLLIEVYDHEDPILLQYRSAVRKFNEHVLRTKN